MAARWLELTRVRLPAASRAGWPIRLDHCFMRVCLDNAVGRRWDDAVRPPAIRHMAVADLERAVALAERILGDPSALDALNRNSLSWRGKRGPHARVSTVAATIPASDARS